MSQKMYATIVAVLILPALALTAGCTNNVEQQGEPVGVEPATEPAPEAVVTDEPAPEQAAAPRVKLQTSMGDIIIELDEEAAPVTVENFLQYIKDDFYDGTIFHRVIKGFMIQGGGFTPDMQRKKTRAAIVNEASNGLANLRGTIAMARTQALNSATSQFFINHKDNPNLNYPIRGGYAVFGRVIEGMEVVDEIANVGTGRKAGMADVPREAVIIQYAEIVSE